MAAPSEKTTKNLTGKWNVNYTYSDSSEPGLIIQGISYLVRKGILAATITIETNQYEAAPNPPNEHGPECWHIDIAQSASGMSTEERRCLDNTFRQHSDWLFGNVRGRSTWVSLDEIEDEYLKNGWLVEGEGKNLIHSYAESEDYGWTADQIWGFQEVDGQRHHCRNFVIKKGDQRAQFRFVYDYDS
ncbi:hypothetical protein NQ176_g4997 [Zarea fungicola]|uniref:Uncharacterized protein n=1 Tax=Zarea fungicola TaxID=93591 RepID=A0ACC1NBG4_9HYPO|nr:hypothetical protein NQ176_g4997 [Lecanicillium fungicola]